MNPMVYLFVTNTMFVIIFSALAFRLGQLHCPDCARREREAARRASEARKGGDA